MKRLNTATALLALSVLLGVLVIYPMARLVVLALTRDGTVSFANMAEVFSESANLEALANSLTTGFLTTLFATAIGFVLSWLIERTDIGLKRLFRTVLVLPFFIPPFITAFAWRRLLGRGGYVNDALVALLGLERGPLEIYGGAGVIAVSTIYTFPYAFIILSRSMRNVDASLEEAARSAGASRGRVVLDILLPVLLPSVGATAVIVFVTAISMFGIPVLLGTPGGFIVLTTRIFGYIGSFGNPNGINIAASLSLVLVVVAVCGLLLQNYLTRRERYAVITGKSSVPAPMPLGPWRGPITGAVGLFALAVVAAPILAVTVTSVMQALGLAFRPENLTIRHFVRLFTEMPMVIRALRNSGGLAVVVPTVLVIFAVGLHYLRRAHHVPGGRFLDVLVSTPYAVPGTVIGVAMIAAWIRPVFGISIYNTIWILFVAYVARFMIFPMRTIGAAWQQIDSSLEEVARVSGASRGHVLKDVSVPLLAGGIGAGWLLAFMPSLTELTLSILLYSPGNETIGVTAYNIIQEGLITVASALSVVIIAVVLLLQLGARGVEDARVARRSR
ncbi:MAG: ABC transporter permease subunit [Spirochaetes bacterium]|jgi:iron(III) transport system permease protein|nr:ABC transporter permease subunit [Spirochaetota bacterium]